MSRWHLLKVVVAICHLLLVCCHAFSLPIGASNPATRLIGVYCTASGADCRFGFFAPEVAPERRAIFIMTDAQGHSWSDDLRVPNNPEVNLHIHSIVAKIEQYELRHAVAASWAATMFGRHPDAQEVVVRVDMRDLPSLSLYHCGCRPRWQTTYEAIFVRDDPGEEE